MLLTAISYVLTGILVISGVLVLVQTLQRKGDFGINIKAILSPVQCPNCKHPISRVRVPKDTREMLWGGFTCQNCGKKFDKWLKELPQ